MKLNFKKVTLKNFLSYEDATFDLSNKGFCSINGINKCTKDNSLSNGSGKSTIISAICYALTGETIQGISKDLKRLSAGKKDEAFVKLEFTCDGNEYIVTRDAGKSKNIELIFNGVDVSGKTKTEGDRVLSEYLPNVDRELIGSVILLGQGLPDKFSSLTPIKRKSYLENLLHIDQVYNDVNSKINAREAFLKKEITELNKNLAVEENSLKIHLTRLESVKNRINALSNTDLNIELNKLNDENINLTNEIKNLETSLVENQKLFDEAEKEYKEFDSATMSKKEILVESLNTKKVSFSNKVTELKTKKDIVEKELSHFHIKGCKCPTCGRELGEEYINLRTEKEKELNEISEELKQAQVNLKENDLNSKNELANFSELAKKEGLPLIDKCNTLSDLMDKDTNRKQLLTSKYHENEKKQSALQSKIEALQSNLEGLNKEKLEIEDSISLSTKNKNSLEEKLALDTAKLDRVGIIHNLMKTEFRGYLLTDALNLIRNVAKNYCNKIFGHNELDIEQGTNSLDIIFQGKNYYSLSGGEKQKIDLILQFALRKLLKNYSGLDSNILFLDEIFDNLDATGTESIINFIGDEFSTVNSVFIISHHAQELGLEFDNNILISKDDSGISKIISA